MPSRGRRTWDRTIAAHLLVSGLLASSPARADSNPVSFALTWDAPPQCPDADYLRGQVEALLAGAPPALVWVAARAEVSHRDDGVWTVKLTTDRDGTVGERSLEADACSSLADATALVVALTIDPSHVAMAEPHTEGGAVPPVAVPEPGSPSTSAPSLATPTPASAVEPAVPARRIERPTRDGSRGTPVRWALSPAVAGDLGTLPRLAYGFSLSGAVLVRRVRVELYGAYWPSQTARGEAAIPASEGGKIDLLDGGVRACFPEPDATPRLQRVAVSPCAGMELGALRGRGFGLAPSLAQTGLWIAATLDARMVVRISTAFGIALDVGAALPLRRDAFTLGTAANAPTVHEAGVVEGRAWMGPEFRF